MIRLSRLPKSLFFVLFWLSVLQAGAGEWKQAEGSFLWQEGDEKIALQANGILNVSLGNAPGVVVSFFQWHDKWVYETLGGGTVEKAAALQPDGSVEMSGLWKTTGEAPPLRYRLKLVPDKKKGGILVRLFVRKTAPLELRSGIWCNIGIGRGGGERRLYARPETLSVVGKMVSGNCDALLVEMRGRRSAIFSGDEPQNIRSRVSKTRHGIEMPLNVESFAVGEEREVNLRLGFTDMPEKVPGQVGPSKKRLHLGKITGSGPVDLYAGIELEVDLQGTWDNPYNPKDVTLDAVVTLPSGRSYTQPGFYMVDLHYDADAKVEKRPVTQGWRIRLAATEVGEMRCELRARDRSGEVRAAVAPIRVRRGKGKGFLRQSKVDPRYLAFDDGSGFFPIGHNLPIYPASKKAVDETLAKMAEAGENYNRWWMSASGLGIEWEKELGWYRQGTAARLDYAIKLAEKYDFYYMLCMDTHQDFRTGGWKGNPFNAINGGPCETPREWFTDKQAREFYRRRLRYTVARWGYSPRILTWEFGNEMEGWANTDNAVKLPWHREMSEYLAALDPYRHLITTSWWSKTGPEEFWELPGIDIVQTHCYTNNDANVAEALQGYCQHQWTHFEKPHLFSEFGIRSHSTTADKDPKGWALHNAFWVCVASGASGSTMPWWHRYIDSLDLYFHFTSIRNFTRDLPFGTARWQPLETGKPEYLSPQSVENRDLILTPVSKFGKRTVSEFQLQRDGSVAGGAKITDRLHGLGHKDLQAPPTFVVDYPQPGLFTVQVGRVSNSGDLEIFVDGKSVLRKEFPCGDGIGKDSVYREKWKLWESVYDVPVSVTIPAGRHRIRVENHGKDWINVQRYVFAGCRLLVRPNLLVAGLRSEERAILWIQNRESSWYNQERGKVPVIPPSKLELRGVRDGSYEVEWWETWKGSVSKTTSMTVVNGSAWLELPAIQSDIALKFRWKGK